MEVALSILIPTMPSRSESLDHLLMILGKQIMGNNAVDLEINRDMSLFGKPLNIGRKRNEMLQSARGKYIVFIDDDDEVSENYISLILDAISEEPDCIGINGCITTNGKDERQWFISKDNRKWFTKGDIYYRTPNHISPVKRDIALKAGFPEIAHGEDYIYSMRILPLLKTEVIIPEPLYTYKYVTKK